jgi:Concanavalin A-like lectin/glucanases superfamily
MALIDGLVSYWRLEEVGSDDRLDAHGSNDLTAEGGVGGATGKLGGAGSFDGVGDYLSHADNADLSTGDVGFTIQAWVYLDTTTGGQDLVAKDSSGGFGEYLLGVTDGEFRFQVTDSGGNTDLVQATNFGTASTGTWYLVHAWHDSVNNQIGIAVNAGTPNTKSYTAGVADSTRAFQLGVRAGGSSYLEGRLDAVALWKRVLSSSERSQLYNSGAGLEYPFGNSAGPHRRRRPRVEPAPVQELSW